MWDMCDKTLIKHFNLVLVIVSKSIDQSLGILFVINWSSGVDTETRLSFTL